MGAICSSSDDGSVDSGRGRPRRDQNGNPLSGKTRMKHSDSLSSVELDADDENELALEHHRAVDDLHNAWQSQNNGVAGAGAGVVAEKTKSSTTSTSNQKTASPTITDNSSATSSSGANPSFSSMSFRSSGAGDKLMVGGDLGKQREEAAYDLVDEFFVWDDMRYDLRKDREGHHSRSVNNASNKDGGNENKTGSNNSNKNGASSGGNNMMNNSSNNNGNNAATSSSNRKNRKNVVGTSGGGGGGESDGQKKKTSASSHFVFNDFTVDEFDFDDDDDDYDPDKHDHLSFFSAAAVALGTTSNSTSGAFNNSTNNNGTQNSSASPARVGDHKELSGKFTLDDVTTKHGTSARRNSIGNNSPNQNHANNNTDPSSPSTIFSVSSPKNPSKNNNNNKIGAMDDNQSASSNSPVSPRSKLNGNNNNNENSNNVSQDHNQNQNQQQQHSSFSSPTAFAASSAPLKLRELGGELDEIRNVSFTTLAGHTTRVKVLAVAPGEKEYVSCSSDDFNLTYADLATGKELGAFIGHTENVLHATFSFCGKYLSSTSRDNTMILWDVVTQKAMLTFEHAKVVICSVFSRDSRFIATGCQDKVCRLWEARRGRELGSFAQHEGIIIAMAFAPDNTYVVSASSDRTLRKWSGVPSKEQALAALAAKAKGEKVPPPQVGKPLGLMQGHEGIILSCTFSSDGKYIISNDERLVKIWNAETCVCYRTFNVDKTVTLRNLPENKKLTWTLAAAAPGSFPKHFMVAANNRFLYVFNIETQEEEVNLYCKSPIYCLTAGQKSTALCGDAFGNVYCMKLGNPHLTLEHPSMARAATPGIKSADFS